MNVGITVSPQIVKLGEPVTVTYTSIDCAVTTLSVDNYANPIALGNGPVSGTMKILPLTDGVVNFVITGTGKLFPGNDGSIPEVTCQAICTIT